MLAEFMLSRTIFSRRRSDGVLVRGAGDEGGDDKAAKRAKVEEKKET